ncbi:MAG: ACT domain-containing protein [Myxococcota bacterium]|nr:ACT domain-containing protein [Myxococcota bacterium]
MKIVVHMQRAEGDLERLMGLFRRRGWQVASLDARSTGDGAAMTVDATLEGETSPDLLVRQVARMLEVQSIEVDQGEPLLARVVPLRVQEV